VATISGTAYTFNTRDVIAGATIEVAELPGVVTTTGEDGSYQLEVPAGETVTLSISADGHHTIFTQTFTLDVDHDGADLVGVNFQTPTDDVYEGLKALVAGFTGVDPFADDTCVIVATVGDSRLNGMPFAEFIEFAPHGVEGATVTIEPDVGAPIYFNEDVLPDPAQDLTSIDGGVMFVNVPAGEYELAATHPDVEFATVTARCEPGRIVNANPVWGLVALPGGA